MPAALNMAAAYTATDFVFAELLPTIFQNCTASDLVRWRLVCHSWKQVATRLLLTRGCLQIKFKLDRDQQFAQSQYYSVLAFISPPSNAKIARLCGVHFKLRMQDETKKTLPNFFRLVSSHQFDSSLPVSNFDFSFTSADLNRNQPQLLSFFQTYGPKIRALTLDNCIDYFVGHRGMPNFLLQYTPNLEFLQIVEDEGVNAISDVENEIPCKSIIEMSRGARTNNNTVTLERLKKIEVGPRPGGYPGVFMELYKPTLKILPQVLKIAPRIEQIFFKHLFCLQTVSDLFLPAKPDFIRVDSLYLREDDLFFGDNGVEVLKTAPEVGLRHLQLNLRSWPRTWNCWKRGASRLCQTIQANLNSLCTIWLLDAAPSMLHSIQGSALKIPALPKVTQLKLWFLYSLEDEFDQASRNSNNEVFALIFSNDSPRSPENSLKWLLPNLETVEVKVWTWKDVEFAQKLWPFWRDRLDTVKMLKVEVKQFDHRLNADKGAEALAMSLQLCPEVTKLDVCWPFCQFPVLLTPIWSSVTLAQLTNLTLGFIVDDDLEILDNFVDLDAAITGLSTEAVQEIYSRWERSGKWEDEEKEVKVNSSILNLKNLQKFKLEFSFDFDDTGLNFDTKPRMLISAVSAQFGFGLMKNLEIDIFFNFLSWKPLCPECGEKIKDAWYKLHSPLLSFSNVTLDVR